MPAGRAPRRPSAARSTGPGTAPARRPPGPAAALADDHRGTEEALRASGLPYTLLRNGWYHENYTENLAPVLEHGTVVAAAVAAALKA
ncbi:hypothetical protein GCM10009535_52070 [Streptomyces thermocarboxydovorans]|uniref:Uncharacterized protein n=1 Tax=Streptomyces thermocarboxydovorans TaxID=59298 RepID=A0ABN1HSX7_9ACTN